MNYNFVGRLTTILDELWQEMITAVGRDCSITNIASNHIIHSFIHRKSFCYKKQFSASLLWYDQD